MTKNLLTLLALAALFLAFLPGNASAQIFINGNPQYQIPGNWDSEFRQSVTNQGMINEVGVHSFDDPSSVYEFLNYGLVGFAQLWGNSDHTPGESNTINNYGRIQFAEVHDGGRLTNRDNASIGALLSFNSYITNMNNAKIDTLSVADQGLIQNKDNAYIGTLNLNDNGYGGGYYDGYGNYLYFSSIWATNQDSATISRANVQGALLENRGNAHIGSADVANNGQLDNLGHASIGGVTVSNGGQVQNLQNASIGTAMIDWEGRLYNRDNASIGSLTVWAYGQVENQGNASIGTASVAAEGRLRNMDNASIGSASVSRWGWIDNYASIDSLSVTGGEVYNGGDDYYGSYYSGSNARIGSANINQEGRLYNRNGASIDTLSVTGNGQVYNVAAGYYYYDLGNNTRIGSASINQEGYISNVNGASIDTLSVAGNGQVYNGNYSTIGSVAITGNGQVENRDYSYIGNIFVDGNRAMNVFTDPYDVLYGSMGYKS